ncbi:hypothetical protein [Paracoccus alkenifer]|nr:hypothetical protein [Paracoccus alkenifer]
MRWTERRPRRHAAGLALPAALCVALVALPAAAQVATGSAPISANDWLTTGTPPLPPPTAWRPGDAIPPDAQILRAPGGAASDMLPATGLPPAVGVTRLAEGNPDGKGAIPAEAARLPRDLWGPAPAGEIAQEIARAQPRLSAGRWLLQRMLTAQLDPPTGTAQGDEGRLFLARVDRLIALGRLDDAESLLRAAGWKDRARFQRRFDIALLRDEADEVCHAIAETPGLAPDLGARIYCLARAGDWSAAALTLHGAQAGGLLEPQLATLLDRFLDDGSADLSADLPPPVQVSALEFRLFEAIGQPLATGDLELGFAWSDLTGNAGWKARIEAAERLSRAGAIDPLLLAATYLEQSPAASGGVWDRAAAFQKLDEALALDDTAAVGAMLPAATALFARAGLAMPFARLVGPQLDGGALDMAAAETAAYLRLLTGLPAGDAAALPPDDRALIALAAGDAAGFADTDTAPGAAYAAALMAEPQNAPPPGGRGLALLSAIADVDAGLDGDTARASAGLRRMVELGQPADARMAAVELLLGEHMGLRR